MSTPRSFKTRAFLVFMAIACLGTVTAGLSIIEPPATMRLKKVDERRLNDLKAIIRSANDAYDTDGVTPESLEDLLEQSSDRLKSTDPVTDSSYEYRKLSESRIEVCATFSASNEVTRAGDTVVFDKRSHTLFHEAGRHCFEFNLQDDN